jgi:hypothetical protein
MFTTLLSILVLSIYAMGNATAETRPQTFIGEAYDPDSGDLLYTEQHSLELTNGTPKQETVVYVWPNGDELARKEMTYWKPQRPAYRLTVSEPQRTETVDPGDNGVTVESVKSGTLEWPDESASVIDGGFHYFILEHFDTLLDGETVDFEFLTPARVSWTSLRISPEDPANGQLVLNLNLQNSLLSWAVSDIELTYDIDKQRLLRYSGLTNLPKPGGGNYKARIEYKYPQANPQ